MVSYGLKLKNIQKDWSYVSRKVYLIFVYQSNEHVAAQYTILNFQVIDIEEAVHNLTASGIAMEHYDLPEIKTDHLGICRNDTSFGPKAIAWFKDPAGNIMSVLQE